MNDIKTSIEEGQRYVDDPVYAFPRYELCTPIARAVAEICGTQRRLPRPVLTHYERTRLRWLKPDGKGGLIPK